MYFILVTQLIDNKIQNELKSISHDVKKKCFKFIVIAFSFDI